MTVLKHADDKQREIDELCALSSRRGIDARTRRRIEDEIWAIRLGVEAEREAAYAIDFAYAQRASFVIIHDLRIEYRGRVAQIDHLVINRAFDIWVCETKSYKGGVKVNEFGEWHRYVNRRPVGTHSPILQNEDHIAVLEDLIDGHELTLPKRALITLKPTLIPVVLVSNEALITRPRGATAGSVKGLDSVMKIEAFRGAIESRFDERNPIAILSRLVGQDVIERLGAELAALHRPLVRDWAGHFGVSPAKQVATDSTSTQAPSGTAVCAGCGDPVSSKVADWTRSRPKRHGDQVLCWNCQRDWVKSNRTTASTR